MSAYLVDPFKKRIKRVDLPELGGPEEDMLMGAAVEEGARAQDFVSCAKFLQGHTLGVEMNAYSLWQKTTGRAVLFIGNKTEDSRHGFRIGRPGKFVKSTVFWGRGLVLRYERTKPGVHRTIIFAGEYACDFG